MVNHKTIAQWMGLSLWLGLLVGGQVLSGSEARPNFIIVLCDDLGYGDLACYGHESIKSPNIDRLARQGVKLTSCYAAAPNCSPSRTGLMTGRTPYRVGIHNWIPLGSPMHVSRDEVTLATLLRRAGYATCHVGKWHLNGDLMDDRQPQPSDHGFDYWFSTQNNALPSHRNPDNFVRNGKPVGKLTGYSSQLVTDEAIKWLRDLRPHDRPFFLFVCYHEPHEPIETDPRFSRLYPDTGKHSPYDPETSSLAAHHGNITQMDFHFGRLMGFLDQSGLSDQTVIIFTSDNGPAITAMHPHGSAGPLRDKKGSLYDGGIRVPGIVRWPGVTRAGSVSDVPVSGVDWLPTVCRAAGVEVPGDRVLDGTDVRAALRGEEVERPKPLYWHFVFARSEPKVAIRDGRWKLLATLTGPPLTSGGDIRSSDQRAIKTARLDRFQLYDLDRDVSEQQDLAGARDDIRQSLAESMRSMYREVQAESPVWPEWKWPRREGQRIRAYVEERRRAAKQRP